MAFSSLLSLNVNTLVIDFTDPVLDTSFCRIPLIGALQLSHNSTHKVLSSTFPLSQTAASTTASSLQPPPPAQAR
jgi:hypothetical protein